MLKSAGNELALSSRSMKIAFSKILPVDPVLFEEAMVDFSITLSTRKSSSGMQ
jgi:hypothetical protein